MNFKREIKVYVLADFANLTKEEYAKVVKETQKKYPEVIVLPSTTGSTHNKLPDEVYIYYLCTIEPILFSKKGVKVVYIGLKSKKIKTLIALELKK